MKASELRIGNWVFKSNLDRSLTGQFQIKGFDLKDFEGAIYEPIPITEEWLVKFGFEKKGDYWFPEKCWHRYLFHGYVLNLEPEGCGMVHAQAHYVHQLQNLYFALTVKELTTS